MSRKSNAKYKKKRAAKGYRNPKEPRRVAKRDPISEMSYEEQMKHAEQQLFGKK